MDRLGKLFGSLSRVKLLRLFIFNQDTSFTLAEASRRSSLDLAVVRRELATLQDAGVVSKRGVRAAAKYQANSRYEHLAALEAFIRDTTVLKPEYVIAALRKAGTLRVVALSGLFTGALETRVDLLVAGDAIDLRVVAKAVKGLEAELGREIRYAVFETPDFRYRLGVYDRLLRDVFDYPHRLILDRIGLRP